MLNGSLTAASHHVCLEVGYFSVPISAGHLSCRWMDVEESVMYIWELFPRHLPSCRVWTLLKHIEPDNHTWTVYSCFLCQVTCVGWPQWEIMNIQILRYLLFITVSLCSEDGYCLATHMSTISSRSTVKMKDNKLQRAVENWSALLYQVCKRQRGFN